MKCVLPSDLTSGFFVLFFLVFVSWFFLSVEY